MRSTFQFNGITGRGSAVALTILVAGCSADIARFDSTSFSLDGNGGSTASIPTPPERVYARNDDNAWKGPVGAGGYVPPASSDRDVQVSALPSPVSDDAPPRSAAPSYASPPPSSYASRRNEYPRRADNVPQPSRQGEAVEVRPGDTLYGLSRRYNVSVAELMSTNGMSNPSLKPGQQIYLPSGHGAGRRPMPRQTETAALRPTPPAVAAKYSGTYTVQPGDSLYGLSRQYNVSLAELQQANAIVDVRKVRPGTVLRVPSTAGDTTVAASEPPRASAPATAPAESNDFSSRPIASTTQPTLLNGSDGDRRVASLDQGRATDATPDREPAAAESRPEAPSAAPASEPAKQAVSVDPPKTDIATPSLPPASPKPPVEVAAVTPAQVAKSAPAAQDSALKLRWPVKGKVIAEFGQRNDGTHNDGINLAVPIGSEVHAAEGGVVAYAGSELKGYGNLILIRHDNGWVTAYAHNDEMMVKRGDKVHRGQIIAKAGNTGTVDQPQLHFELRQGAKPVDPTPFMERS